MNIPGLPRPHQLPEAQYTDYFEMGFEPCVFKLFFGQLNRREDEHRLSAGLVMSPAFAKALLQHMQSQLAQYEEEFGPIPDWYGDERAEGASA